MKNKLKVLVLTHAVMHASVYENVKTLLDNKTKQELARIRAETVAASGDYGRQFP